MKNHKNKSKRKNKIKNIEDDIKYHEAVIRNLEHEANISYMKDDIEYRKNIQGMIEEEKNAITELQAKYIVADSEIDSLIKSQEIVLNAHLKQIDAMKNIPDELKKMAREYIIIGDAVEDYYGVVSDVSVIRNVFEELDELYNASSINAIQFLEKDIINKLINQLGFSTQQARKIIKTYVDSMNDVEKVTNTIIRPVKRLILTTEELAEKHKTLSEKFEESTDKIKEYTGYLKELNTEEGLSGKSKDDIIKNYPELLAYLGDDVKLTEKLIELKEKEEQTQKRLYTDMLSYSKENIKGNKELIVELAGYYDEDFDNFETLAELKYAVENNLISKLSKEWKDYYKNYENVNGDEYQILGNFDASGIDTSSEMIEWFKERGQFLQNFSDTVFDIGGFDLNTLNTPSKNKDTSSKSSPTLKVFEQLPSYNEQIKDTISNLEGVREEIEKIENEASIAEAKNETSKLLKLQQELIEKRKEEQELLTKTVDELKSLQAVIADKFKAKFDLSISDLSEVDIKNLKDKIDKELVDLQNELAQTESETTKKTLQEKINNLELDESLFDNLLSAFKNSESDIKDLGEAIINSLLEGLNIKNEITEKAEETKENFKENIQELKDEFESLQEELNTINLEQFERSINKTTESIKPFDNELDLLATKLKLLPANQIAEKMNVVAEQFTSSQKKGSYLRSEFDRLSKIIPKNVEESKVLISALSSLQNEIKDTTLNTISYQKELDNLRLDNIANQFNEVNDKLNRELKQIDNNLKMLKDGLVSGLDIDFERGLGLPLIPKTLIEKHKSETEKLIQEHKDREEKIQKINQTSYKLQEEESKKHFDNVMKEFLTHYIELSTNITKELQGTEEEYKSSYSIIENGIEISLQNIADGHKNTFTTILDELSTFVENALKEYEKIDEFLLPNNTNSNLNTTTNNNTTNKTSDSSQPSTSNQSNISKASQLIDNFFEKLNNLIANMRTVETVEDITTTSVSNVPNSLQTTPDKPQTDEYVDKAVSEINYNAEMSKAVTEALINYNSERESAILAIKEAQQDIIDNLAKGLDVTELRENVLKMIDEQTAKDVNMQYTMQEDILRQQNENSKIQIDELRQKWQDAVDSENIDAVMKISQQYQDMTDLYFNTTEKIKSSIKSRYDYEFSLMDKLIDKQERNTSNIEQQIKQISLTQKDNYESRLKLNNELLQSEQKNNAILQDNITKSRQQQDALQVGGFEWNLINQQIEKYNQALANSNYEIEQINQNVLKIEFDSAMHGLTQFESKMDELNYQLKLIQSLKSEDVEGINNVYYKMIDISQQQTDHLYGVLEQLKEKIKLQAQSSTMWSIIAQQIAEVEAQIRSANLAIIEQAKTAFGSAMQGYIPEYKERRRSSSRQTTIPDTGDWMDGREKELEIAKLMKFVEENNLELNEKQLKILESKNAVRKEDLEIIRKELELQQLQKKLEELKNQKTIRQLKQQEDGSWDYEYVADEDAIDDLEDQIIDKELDLIRAINDLNDQLKQAMNSMGGGFSSLSDSSRKHYDEQIKLLNEILKNAEDRVYKSADEFRKALESVGLDLPIDEMVAEYEKYFLETAEIFVKEVVSNITQQLNAQDEEFKKAGSASGQAYVSELLNQIDSIMNGEGNIVEKHKAIVDLLSSRYADFALAGNESGMNFVEGLMTSMTTEDYEVDLDEVVDDIVDKLTLQSDKLKEQGQNAGFAVVQGVIAGIEEIVNNDEIQNKTELILDLLDKTNEYGTLGQALGESFVDGLTNTITSVGEAMDGDDNALTSALDDVIGQLDEKIGEFEEKGDIQGQAYADALKKKLSDAKEQTGLTLEDIIKLLNEFKEFDLAGVLSGEAYKKAMGLEFDDVKTLLDTKTTEATTQLDEDKEDFAQSGTTQGEAYGNALESAFNTASGKVKTIMDNLEDYLNGKDFSFTVTVKTVEGEGGNNNNNNGENNPPPQTQLPPKPDEPELIPKGSVLEMLSNANLNPISGFTTNNHIPSISNSNIPNITNNNQSSQTKTTNHIEVKFPNAKSSGEIEKAMKSLIESV